MRLTRILLAGAVIAAAMFAAASCGDDVYSPYALISFTLTATNAKPIPGLRLTSFDAVSGATNAVTNSTSSGMIVFNIVRPDGQDYITNDFVIEDVDGVSNGGKFETVRTNAIASVLAKFDIVVPYATN